jgi:Holliday junction DNA helicase RuvA
MIGWLEGLIVYKLQRGNRSQITLNCNGVGYEVQITQREWLNLEKDQTIQIWIHKSISADNWQFFGFISTQERDIFRELISVNGVGPQAGMALMQECKPQELVEAISNGDLRRLCRAQGIGKRTAERLAVELRASIAAFAGMDPAPSLAEGISSEQMPESGADVEATLSMLGYDDLEIRRAIRAIAEGSDGPPPPGDDQDAWLRGCLQWLSRDSA